MFGCIRVISSFFSFVVFALGLVIVAGGIFLKYNKPEFWSLIHMDEYDDYYQFGYIGLIILGFVVLVCSMFGMYGSCKKRNQKCALTVYQFGVLILFVIFMGIGVAIVILFEPFYKQIKADSHCNSTNSDLEFLQQANQMYLEASEQLFCKIYQTESGQTYPDNRGCTCYIESTKQAQWTKVFGDDFFTSGKYLVTDQKTDDTATEISQCPNFEETIQQAGGNFPQLYEDWSPLAAYIEDTFNCAGVCDPVPFYTFSNINDGLPSNNLYEEQNPNKGAGCYKEITHFVGWFKNLATIVSFGAALFLLFSIVLSCCVCCYSSNKRDMNSYVYLQ